MDKKQETLDKLKAEMIRDGVDGGYIEELCSLSWGLGYDAGYEGGKASMDTSANVGRG